MVNGSEPAGLPLLQFFLQKLWDCRTGNLVSWDSYKRLGSARTALARHADQFFEKLPPGDQITTRRILMRLAFLDNAGRMVTPIVTRQTLSEVHAPSNVDDVLDELVKAELVLLTKGTAQSDDRFEILHAVCRYWPRFVMWLDEELSKTR